MLNHRCGGAETLCLVSNRLDGVCQCPANMFKRVDKDSAGQRIETCTSELHQCSCHTLTPSHLHTHTNPHLHSLVCLPSSTSHVTPSHTHSHVHSLTCLPSSTSHSSLPHILTPHLLTLSCRCRLPIAHRHPGGNPLPPYPRKYLYWHLSTAPYWSTV